MLFAYMQNKGADQLRIKRTADQHLCIHYKKSTIPLLSKSEISSLLISSVAVQPGLYRPGQKPEDRFSRDTDHVLLQ